MLRITVELISARGGPPRHLGTAIISNDATGTSEVGNYDATFSKWGNPNASWKRGRVRGFDRVKRGPWDLLFLALRDAVGSRNP